MVADISLIEANTPKLLHTFVRFPFKLYKGNPYWAPPLDIDEKKTLTAKNPAFLFCEVQLMLAYKGREVVGRMALIINHRYNGEAHAQMGRIGWVDFVDDYAVSQVMFDYAKRWHQERGMKELHGPLGFTDFDYQGMLYEGFDRDSTMATIYNYPYYNEHIQRYGFKKKTSWIERVIVANPETGIWDPEKMSALTKLIAQRYNVRLAPITTSKQLKPYAPKMFDLINTMYRKLYGFSTLSQEQADFYIRSYFSFAHPDFIPVVLDEKDEMIGFLIAFPSFTKALRKCQGKLLPFGWWHMFRAMKKMDAFDFYLTAVHPNYVNKGIPALMMQHMARTCVKHRIKTVETNIVLEDNAEMSNIYDKKNPVFESKIVKRRASYVLSLE